MEELARRMVYEQLCRNLNLSPDVGVDAVLDMLRIVVAGPLLVRLMPLVCKDLVSAKHAYLLWPLGLTRVSQALASEIMSMFTRLLP